MSSAEKQGSELIEVPVVDSDIGFQVADVVKTMRLNAGFSRQDIADTLGTDRSHVTRLESGRMKHSVLSHLARIGDLCGFEIKLVLRSRAAGPAK